MVMVVEYRNNSKDIERLKQDLVYWSNKLYCCEEQVPLGDLPQKL